MIVFHRRRVVESEKIKPLWRFPSLKQAWTRCCSKRESRIAEWWIECHWLRFFLDLPEWWGNKHNGSATGSCYRLVPERKHDKCRHIKIRVRVLLFWLPQKEILLLLYKSSAATTELQFLLNSSKLGPNGDGSSYNHDNEDARFEEGSKEWAWAHQSSRDRFGRDAHHLPWAAVCRWSCWPRACSRIRVPRLPGRPHLCGGNFERMLLLLAIKRNNSQLEKHQQQHKTTTTSSTPCQTYSIYLFCSKQLKCFSQ